MANADALSRLPLDDMSISDTDKDELNTTEYNLCSIQATESIINNLNLDNFRIAQGNDPQLKLLIASIDIDTITPKPNDQFHIIGGLLHELKNDGSMVLLVPFTMIIEVLKLFDEGSKTFLLGQNA
jgi:hypothetical protein